MPVTRRAGLRRGAPRTPEPHQDEGTRARVESHLADCPHCREYLSQMRRTIAATHELAEHEVGTMPTDVRERLMQAFREDRD